MERFQAAAARPASLTSASDGSLQVLRNGKQEIPPIGGARPIIPQLEISFHPYIYQLLNRLLGLLLATLHCSSSHCHSCSIYAICLFVLISYRLVFRSDLNFVDDIDVLGGSREKLQQLTERLDTLDLHKPETEHQ